MRRTLLTLLILIFGTTICRGQNLPTYHNVNVETSIEYAEGNSFQKDLLLYVDMLKTTHPYYSDAKRQAQFDKRTKKMYKECGKITSDTDFKVYIAKIAAQLNDGHTAVPYWTTFEKIYPVKFKINGDAPVIVEISPEDKGELLGKEVKSVNGKPFEEILKLARPLVSADNRANYENSIKEYLMFAQFWELLGMSSEVMHITFADGSSAAIEPVDKANLKIAQLQKKSDNRVTAQRGVLFDYTMFEEESICYLQFNQFADRLIYPQYPQLARFDEFVGEMMAEMKRKEINTLVVDLQYNGGGNSQLGDVLLSWLYPHREMRRYDVDVRISELLFTFYPYYRQFTVNGEPVEMGKLYGYMGFDHSKNYAVDYTAPQDPKNHIFNFDDAQIYDGNVVFIQSRNSFSSSTLLLTLARDNGIGTIVGEPSGGKPSHYGDVLCCTLPNTATMVTVSHKHFVRPDKAIDEESLAPDVWVELNDPEKDMVWEWILEKYGKMVE